MSAKKHKSDYLILGVLGALTAAVLLTMTLWGWISQRNKKDFRQVASTYSNSMEATLVLYSLLENVNINVQRSEDMLMEENLSNVDVLVHIHPITPLQHAEIPAIKNWLSTGGILICTSMPRGVIPAIDKYADSFIRSKVKEYEAKATTVKTGKKLAEDVKYVHLASSRIIDTKKIRSERFRKNTVELFDDELGTRIIRFPVGSGSVILLADYSFLSNRDIGKRDNGILAVNLIAYAVNLAKSNSVTFDEYHLGYGFHQGGLSVINGLLFKTTAGWAILCLMFAGILFLINKGRQFGPRTGLEKEQRRSKLEFIYSVGATYRAAKAHALTFRHNYKWFKDKIAASVGTRPRDTNNTIAAAIATKTGAEPETYKSTLDECDQLLKQEKMSDRQLIKIINKLSHIEVEILNEHRISE